MPPRGASHANDDVSSRTGNAPVDGSPLGADVQGAAPHDDTWQESVVRPWGRPSFWIMLMLVMSVVTWRKQSIYGGGVDVVVLAKAALGGLALVMAWAARVSVRHGRPMRNTVVWLALAYALISTFGAWTDGGLSVSGILTARLVLVTLTVALMVKTFPRRTLLEDLLWSFALVATIAAATGAPTILQEGRLHGGVPQMHSNELSLLCAMPVVGLTYTVVQGRARVPHVVALCVLGAALLATVSRTALLTVVLATLVMIVQARRLGRMVTVALVAMPGLLLLIALRTDAARSFFVRDGAGEGEITTLNSRSIVWSASLDHPETWWTRWLGSGLAVKQIPVEGQYWEIQKLDSSWVSALVQAGRVGTALLVFWVCLVVAASCRAPWPDRLLLQGLLAALLVRSVLESGLVDSSPAFLTFLLVSLLAGPVRHGPVPRRRPSMVDPLLAVGPRQALQ